MKEARMMWKIIALLLVGAALCIQAQQTVNFDDIYAQVLGRSGKISMWTQNGSDSDNNTTDASNQITITMDALKEVDSSGSDVGSTGSTKHSFNSFASQDFTFSDLVSGDVPNSDADSVSFSFEGTLKDLTSTLKVYVYIVKEDGNLTLGTQSSDLKKGMMKWSIELSNWQFCGTAAPDVECKKGQTDEIGAFVDLTITIKAKEDAEIEDKGNGIFDMGGDTMYLSDQVEKDGAWETMATGYPKFEKQGSKYSFTFRFPKFTTRAFYDPDITLGELNEDDDPDIPSGGPTEATAGDSNGSGVSAQVTAMSLLLTMLLSAWIALWIVQD